MNEAVGKEPSAESQKGARVLLFTGKGGVGKTTIAAATALRAAELGHRVLIMSSDPAHSLGDALGAKLGPEPQEIAEGVDAQEIDVYYSIQKHWGTLRQYVIQLFQWQDVDETLAEEMAALPGMEEGATFLWVEQFQREGDYDVLLIDSAPTGETLKLLSLPLVGEWWVQRASPLTRQLARVAAPVVRALSRRPVPQEEVSEEAADLYAKLMSIHGILTDPSISSIRLVVNPEKMVIEESQRAYTSLQLYGYSVDAVVVNRVLPEVGVGPLFQEYLTSQRRHLEEIEQAFPSLPILRVPHLGKEAHGLALLSEIGRTLYGERDPASFFTKERPFRLTPRNGTYLLEMHLPFLGSEDVSVLQVGGELVVQARGQRRNIFLPKFLGFYSARDAKLEDGWLRVVFEKATEEKT